MLGTTRQTKSAPPTQGRGAKIRRSELILAIGIEIPFVPVTPKNTTDGRRVVQLNELGRQFIHRLGGKSLANGSVEFIPFRLFGVGIDQLTEPSGKLLVR